MDRRVDELNPRQRFLIVCEGEKTEPQYFERFRVPHLIVDVKGVGMNTLSLVEKAIELSRMDNYDQVWCVFDKDDFPPDNFENAIQKARDARIKVAYSNQAFELWYLLHFEYLQTAIDRSAYIRKLSDHDHLGFTYKKNDPAIYEHLQCKMDVAIRNAERLNKQYDSKHPAKNDPSTTVFLLVKELQKQAKPLSG
jgi:hypothetical protein